jgi:hypothetical protein
MKLILKKSEIEHLKILADSFGVELIEIITRYVKEGIEREK